VWSRGRSRLIAATLVALLLAAGLLAADWWFCRPEGLTAHYVGRNRCIRCHAKEFHAWFGSDHEEAMAAATPQTVRGNFENQQFSHFGVTSKFFRRGDEYCVTTDGPTGKSAKRIMSTGRSCRARCMLGRSAAPIATIRTRPG
jgi:hypothetical protein